MCVWRVGGGSSARARAPAGPQESKISGAGLYYLLRAGTLDCVRYYRSESSAPSFPVISLKLAISFAGERKDAICTWPQPERQFAGRAPSTGCGHRSTSSASLPARTTAGRCPHSLSRNTRVPPGTRGPAARMRRSPQTASPRCRPRAARRSVARAPSSACSLPDGSGRALSPLRGPAAVRVMGWVGWR